MALYPVDIDRYKPPQISQKVTALSEDGLDDCRVIATQAFVATATSGETQLTARGMVLTYPRLVRQAVAMRESLGPADQTGPLHTGHAREMVKNLWPHLPTMVPDDLSESELRDLCLDGWCASLSGNPGWIRASDISIARAGNVGHEYFIWGARRRKGVGVEGLVYDPYRPKTAKRGEWIPWKHIKQFSYNDSDGDLTAVFAEPRGSWTAEALGRQRVRKRLTRAMDELETRHAQEVADLQRQLAACREQPGDSSAAIAEAERLERGRIIESFAEHGRSLASTED